MAVPSAADFDKARRTAKMHLIAHAMFMANKADTVAESIRAAVRELKAKEIDEAEFVKQVHEMVVDELHEMQLYVLDQHLYEIGCATGAITASRARAVRLGRDA